MHVCYATLSMYVSYVCMLRCVCVQGYVMSWTSLMYVCMLCAHVCVHDVCICVMRCFVVHVYSVCTLCMYVMYVLYVCMCVCYKCMYVSYV